MEYQVNIYREESYMWGNAYCLLISVMVYAACMCHLSVIWYMPLVCIIFLLYDICYMHMSYSCCMIYATCLYHISVIWCMLHACIVYLLHAYIIYLCYMIYATCVYIYLLYDICYKWLHSSVVECLQRTNKYLQYFIYTTVLKTIPVILVSFT